LTEFIALPPATSLSFLWIFRGRFDLRWPTDPIFFSLLLFALSFSFPFFLPDSRTILFCLYLNLSFCLRLLKKMSSCKGWFLSFWALMSRNSRFFLIPPPKAARCGRRPSLFWPVLAVLPPPFSFDRPYLWCSFVDSFFSPPHYSRSMDYPSLYERRSFVDPMP